METYSDAVFFVFCLSSTILVGFALAWSLLKHWVED